MTDTDTTHARVALPASGALVPADAARWRLRETGSMRTRDGEAFAVEVRAEAGDLLGTLENEGRGGGTWMRHADPAARDEWRRVAALLDPRSEEPLADALGLEAGAARQMDRLRSAALRGPDTPPGEYVALRGVTYAQGEACARDERDAALLRGRGLTHRWVRRAGWVAL